jgi:hypothetical protein
MSQPARRHGFAVLLATLCVCAWFAPAAAAEFGPIQLVSKSAKEQAGFAREAALSADGHYVAFRGELGGHIGIFRRDLTTGAVTLVVESLNVKNEIEGAAEAEAPSISADGRYVSFTSNRSLDPVADPEPGTADVYVADLASIPPTFQLASAVEGVRMSGSSSAAPRVALSADGGEVAFIDDEQVYVRRLAEPDPVLISGRRDPATGATTTEPVPGGGAWANSGAALSADGNAVAWAGEDLPDQVSVSPAEEERMRAIESKPSSGVIVNRYFEPLWREVPSGLTAPPTRRIVGGGDQFPDLLEDHKRESLGAAEGVGWGTGLPQLSADGLSMAVIGSPEENNDLFLVEMAPGLDGAHSVQQLTKWTNPSPGTPSGLEQFFQKSEYLVFTGPIRQCAISPDGTRIAFTTLRQSFTQSPQLLTTPQPVAPSIAVELYQIDLEGQTIERVTPGPGTGGSLARTASKRPRRKPSPRRDMAKLRSARAGRPTAPTAARSPLAPAPTTSSPGTGTNRAMSSRSRPRRPRRWSRARSRTDRRRSRCRSPGGSPCMPSPGRTGR